VLSWGHGGQGQLGHGSVESKKIPSSVEALAHEHIIYISCGGSSSAAVTGKIIHLTCHILLYTKLFIVYFINA
jgi:alpha-tubulin suppressor-like RCC1 family protein